MIRSIRTRHVVKPPQVKTVEKALRLLLYFTRAPGEVGLQEVSRAVGVHPSTAYRLLSVLVRHGFLSTGAGPGRYALGLRLAELGHTVLQRLTLREKARPHLERLAHETRETVHLMALDGDNGIYIDRIESPQRIRVASNIGYRESLHCSAIGKAILAHLRPARLEEILGRGLPRMTARTIVDGEQLRRHLREVAARGFAIDNEEGEPDVRCVGAAIFDHQGIVMGGLSLSGPAFRLPLSKLARWGPKVRAAAAAVSGELGSPSGATIRHHPLREARRLRRRHADRLHVAARPEP
jgi:IclR family transcriptional regulator, KDG regulon repressor